MDENQDNSVAQSVLSGGLSEEGFSRLRNQSIRSKFRMSLFGAMGGAVLFAGATAALAAAGSLGLVGLLAAAAIGITCIYLSQRESFVAMEADQELGAIKIAMHANGLGNAPVLSPQHTPEAVARQEPFYPQNERKSGVPWAATVQPQAVRNSVELKQRT